MVAHLKLLIAKMKRDRFGQSSERGQRLLDQMELQLEELEASAAEDEAGRDARPEDTACVVSFTRKKPVRAPLPAHLPRERVVVPRRAPARAAAASWPSLARISPRRWRWCRGNGR
jgi:transposase